MIGPVSRSQMSPNGSTITLANGASRARASAAASSAATSRTCFALAVGMDGRGEGRDLGLRRREVVLPQLGMARKTDPDRLVRRPFGQGRSGHARRAYQQRPESRQAALALRPSAAS